MFTQLRLYAALGVALVMAALVAGLLWYRGQSIAAEAALKANKSSLQRLYRLTKAKKMPLTKSQPLGREMTNCLLS
jgi:hypothetical protein